MGNYGHMIKFLKTGYGLLKDELIPSIEKINSEWKIDLPETDNFERLDNSNDGSFGGASTEVFKFSFSSIDKSDKTVRFLCVPVEQLYFLD